PLGALNVVEDLGTGEITVKGEVAGETTYDSIVDQLDTQFGVVLERSLLTRVFFPEPSPFNGIVHSRGADIVGDQVIMGDDVALVGMVPEPPHVFDQLACMVDQGIVDGYHTSGAVPGLRITLQPRQASVVEGRGVPRHLSEPTVETGLIRGDHKLAVDTTDGLLFGNHQPREVFGKMVPFRGIGKQVAKDLQGVLHNSWEVHNGRHQGNLPTQSSGCLRDTGMPSTIRPADQFAKVQLLDIKMSSVVGEEHLFTLLLCRSPKNDSMKLSSGVLNESRVRQAPLVPSFCCENSSRLAWRRQA